MNSIELFWTAISPVLCVFWSSGMSLVNERKHTASAGYRIVRSVQHRRRSYQNRARHSSLGKSLAEIPLAVRQVHCSAASTERDPRSEARFGPSSTWTIAKRTASVDVPDHVRPQYDHFAGWRAVCKVSLELFRCETSLNEVRKDRRASESETLEPSPRGVRCRSIVILAHSISVENGLGRKHPRRRRSVSNYSQAVLWKVLNVRLRFAWRLSKRFHWKVSFEEIPLKIRPKIRLITETYRRDQRRPNECARDLVQQRVLCVLFCNQQSSSGQASV